MSDTSSYSVVLLAGISSLVRIDKFEINSFILVSLMLLLSVLESIKKFIYLLKPH